MRVKEYRGKELKSFTCFITMLFFVLCLPFPHDVESIEDLSTLSNLIYNVTITLFVPLLISFSDSICPYWLKEIISYPLYGETIFTKIEKGKVSDIRIDIDEAKQSYKDIIRCKNKVSDDKTRRKYENKEWYKIYKKYDGKDDVNQTQADYLLCRDMFVISMFGLISYFILIFIGDDIIFSGTFICIILCLGFISWCGMRNKMKRFVLTVIATDLTQKGFTRKGGDER